MFFDRIERARDALGNGQFGNDLLAEKLTYLTAAGTPSDTGYVPTFIGQAYFDSLNEDWYVAAGTGSSADFVPSGAAETVASAVINNRIGRAKTGGFKVGAIGDSYTAYFENGSIGQVYTRTTSYLAWCRFFSNGRLNVLFDDVFATSGHTTTQMVADGFHTSAKDADLDICVICAGSNDIFNSITADTTITNLGTMIDKVLESEATVVALAIPPRNSLTEAQADAHCKVNNWLRYQSIINPRIVYVDPRSRVADAGTGNYRTNYVLADGIHLSSTGARVYGKALWDAISGFVAPRDNLMSFYHDTYNASNNPNGNLLANGLMDGTGGNLRDDLFGTVSGSVATGWEMSTTNSNTTVNFTASKVARTDGVEGDWQQIAFSGTSPNAAGYSAFMSATPTVIPAIGTELEAMAEVQLDSSFTAVKALSLIILYVSANELSYDMFYYDEDYPNLVDLGDTLSGVLRTPKLVIPAGTTSIRVRPGVVFEQNTTIAATVRFGRTSLRIPLSE